MQNFRKHLEEIVSKYKSGKDQNNEGKSNNTNEKKESYPIFTDSSLYFENPLTLYVPIYSGINNMSYYYKRRMKLKSYY